MTLIKQADAIEAVRKKLQDWGGYAFEDYRRGLYEAQEIIEALPSADAIHSGGVFVPNMEMPKACDYCLFHDSEWSWCKAKDKYCGDGKCPLIAVRGVKALMALPSAEAEPTVIRSRTLMPTKDFKEWAKRVREENPNAVVIPCDAEIVSADAVQGEWIPCGEKMPKELERVNVTWLNHNPPFYYQHIKDIPQTDTAVYYRGKWYWWDATVIDVLAEYGEDCNAEQIDKDIEVVAWMPLPKPYIEESEVEE